MSVLLKTIAAMKAVQHEDARLRYTLEQIAPLLLNAKEVQMKKLVEAIDCSDITARQYLRLLSKQGYLDIRLNQHDQRLRLVSATSKLKSYYADLEAAVEAACASRP